MAAQQRKKVLMVYSGIAGACGASARAAPTRSDQCAVGSEVTMLRHCSKHRLLHGAPTCVQVHRERMYEHGTSRRLSCVLQICAAANLGPNILTCRGCEFAPSASSRLGIAVPTGPRLVTPPVHLEMVSIISVYFLYRMCRMKMSSSGDSKKPARMKLPFTSISCRPR